MKSIFQHFCIIRFDKKIHLPYPDIGGRKALIDLYKKKVLNLSLFHVIKLNLVFMQLILNEDIDINSLARNTNGLTGADIHNILNQAAVQAASKNRSSIMYTDIEYAIDKITLGPSRASAVVSADSMKVTAYHEAGHVLVALNTPGIILNYEQFTRIIKSVFQDVIQSIVLRLSQEVLLLVTCDKYLIKNSIHL
jgi:ATP-dependent metalloprotease